MGSPLHPSVLTVRSTSVKTLSTSCPAKLCSRRGVELLAGRQCKLDCFIKLSQRKAICVVFRLFCECRVLAQISEMSNPGKLSQHARQEAVRELCMEAQGPLTSDLVRLARFEA